MTAFVTRGVGDVVSEILMSRAAYRGALLVLEGDRDVKFWQRRIALSREHVIRAGTKPTVIGAVVGADARSAKGVLGVVDDDHDSLLGRPLPSDNLVRTETRDIETLLLRSPALDDVLHEVGDHDKIDTFVQHEGMSVRDALVSRSIVFGQLRFLNAREQWEFDFKRLSPHRFFDAHSWGLKRSALLDEVAQQPRTFDSDRLEAELASLSAIDPWNMLHGKDTLSVLAIGLRNVIGNKAHKADNLAHMLHIAFDDSMFAATGLAASVRTWESANPGYRVLA